MKRAASIVLALCLFLGGPGGARAEDGPSLEYQVKAVCLYNFVKFIEWQKESFAQEADLHICIIGPSPFGNLTKDLEGREAQGKRVRVLELPVNAGSAALSQCELAYISSVGSEPDSLFARLEEFNTVSVSDNDPRSVLRFHVIDGKVKFSVNLEAAERVRVKISSQLLKLAINTQSQIDG